MATFLTFMKVTMQLTFTQSFSPLPEGPVVILFGISTKISTFITKNFRFAAICPFDKNGELVVFQKDK